MVACRAVVHKDEAGEGRVTRKAHVLDIQQTRRLAQNFMVFVFEKERRNE